MRITGINISYGRKMTPAQYESADASIGVTIAVDDADGMAQFETVSADILARLRAQVHGVLWRKVSIPVQTPAEVARKPAEVAQTPAEVAQKPVEVAQKPVEQLRPVVPTHVEAGSREAMQTLAAAAARKDASAVRAAVSEVGAAIGAKWFNDLKAEHYPALAVKLKEILA